MIVNYLNITEQSSSVARVFRIQYPGAREPIVSTIKERSHDGWHPAGVCLYNGETMFTAREMNGLVQALLVGKRIAEIMDANPFNVVPDHMVLDTQIEVYV